MKTMTNEPKTFPHFLLNVFHEAFQQKQRRKKNLFRASFPSNNIAHDALCFAFLLLHYLQSHPV